MKYEIEIDLPPDIAAKWVPVAFRQVQPSEHYFASGRVMQWTGVASTSGVFLILAPRVEWPGWCSADWLMKDADGSVWAATGGRPVWDGDDSKWDTFGEAFRMFRDIHADLYAAFKDVPAELSLIENPKRTKSDSAV